MKNKGITLIGMPGSGKSTIGKRLAKKLNTEYLDLDVLIYQKTDINDMDYFKKYGEKEFLRLEEKIALDLSLKDKVFAPGGSIVYSKKAMDKIKKETFVIYLKIDKKILKKRLSKIKVRKIVGLEEHGFDNLFDIRAGLYEKYADATLDIKDQDREDILRQILQFM